jgi:hypothetical protein
MKWINHKLHKYVPKKPCTHLTSKLFNSSSLQLKSSYPIFTNSFVSFFNSKFHFDFSFFRFWSPQVWGLIRCTTHWSIGCIPWKTSLENQAVIFSSTGKLLEFFWFNFNLFLWLPFATFAFFMMIFYLDSVWVQKWVYIYFSLRIQNQNFSWKSRQLQLLSEQYIMELLQITFIFRGG